VASNHTALCNRVLVRLTRNPNIRLWNYKAFIGNPIYDKNKIVRVGGHGISDLLGIVGPLGRLLALEIKIGKDDLKVDQVSFRNMIISLGGFHAVVRESTNLEELEASIVNSGKRI
jgi:hypothetical protein